MAVFELFRDRHPFFLGGPVNLVVGINTGNRAMGRDFDNLKVVDFLEFLGLGHCRTGHAGQSRIKTEIVLEGDRCQSLVFILDLDLFLGFKRLMKTIGIAAAFHHTTGEFVNDDDLVVLDNIVGVFLNSLCARSA